MSHPNPRFLPPLHPKLAICGGDAARRKGLTPPGPTWQNFDGEANSQHGRSGPEHLPHPHSLSLNKALAEISLLSAAQ